MHKDIKSFNPKPGFEYTKPQKVIIYVIGVCILICLLTIAYDKAKIENDTLLNGRKLTVNITGVSGTKPYGLYFKRTGLVTHVNVALADIQQYQIGDSVKLLYSNKYDFYMLDKQRMPDAYRIQNMAILLTTVLLACLVIRFWEKRHKNKRELH